MAKTGRRAEVQGTNISGRKIEDFAEDLGRLLGTAQAKAQGWLGQRQVIVKQLQDIRDTASNLMSDLMGARRDSLRKARGRRGGASGRRRNLSPEARARIADAQRRRWAAFRAAKRNK